MSEGIIQLKWTNGTLNEKSRREDREKFVSDNIEQQVANQIMNSQSNEFMTLEENIRPTMSYNDDGYGMSIEESQQPNWHPDMNQSIEQNMNEQIFKQRSKKREEQNEKLSSRHMIIQKSINPFVNNGNYIDHIDMEDSFLRPKDSNFET